MVVKAPGQAHADPGQRVAVSLPAAALHLFDDKGLALERRIPIADLRVPHAD
jgi:multiple sugar transport system ATP-binding protein